MDLGTLTQLEIEQEFDNSKVIEKINEEIADFTEELHELFTPIEVIMSKYVTDISELDVRSVMYALLKVIGNDKATILLGETKEGKITELRKGMKPIDAKDIPLGMFMKSLLKNDDLQEMFEETLFDFVIDIVKEMDTILFDIVQRVVMVEDGQFRTLTYVRSEITFDEDTNLMARYNRFRLPMIEKPDDWTETKRGGYYLNKRKVTTNRGEGKQPKLVLDALNKLQSNGWKHKQNIDEEHSYLVAKFEADNFKRAGEKNSWIAADKADAMCLTAEETYDAIGDRTIYFEWRFDHRGRAYSTGYDINLQGDKFKKGALRPVLWER